MTITEELGHFVAGLSRETIPEEVWQKAHTCLLNGYGIAMAGLATPYEPVARTAAQAMYPGGGAATFLGNGETGAGRRILTGFAKGRMAVPYAAQRPRHSARVAARFSLKMCRLERLRSWLKWLNTEEWTAANFCKLRIRRKRCIARSRRRNGRWEFSARLLSQRPVSCRSAAPISFSAEP